MLLYDIIDLLFHIWLSLVKSIDYGQYLLSELCILLLVEVCVGYSLEQVVEHSLIFAESVSNMEAVINYTVIVDNEVVQ